MAVIKGIASPQPAAPAAVAAVPARVLVRLKNRSIEEPGCITRDAGHITEIPAAHFSAQHHELVNPPTVAALVDGPPAGAGTQSSAVQTEGEFRLFDDPT